MTTMLITVDLATAAPPTFTFDLSYTDASGTKWTGSVGDEGTVRFLNSGQYTLSSGRQEETFTFTDVSVVLGSSLQGGASRQCGSQDPYDLGSIVLPRVDERNPTNKSMNAWCQEVPRTAKALGGTFVDPQLGLSNSTTSTPPPDPKPQDCDCGS